MQYSKWVTLGFGALCLVAVAGVLNAEHLYYMAAILLTLPGVSYVLGWFALNGLEFTRSAPSVAWENEAFAVTYTVRNATRLSRFFLSVHEPLPGWVGEGEAAYSLFNVPSRGAAAAEQMLTATRRGVFATSSFAVTALDPLGVFAFTRRIQCEAETIIFPAALPIGTNTLTGAGRYGYQELSSVLLSGSSVEPDGVRLYSPGDALRRVHWRQTARTGRLTVMEFEESQSISVAIALDLRRAQGANGDAVEWAIRAAASLAEQAIRSGASVSLLLGAGSVDPIHQALAEEAENQSRGDLQLSRILELLARAETRGSEPVAARLVGADSRLASGTTVVAITSVNDQSLVEALPSGSRGETSAVLLYVTAGDLSTDPKRDLLATNSLLAAAGRTGHRAYIAEPAGDGSSINVSALSAENYAAYGHH